MKQVISLLLSVLFVQSLHAGFKNVPTYVFESVSHSAADGSANLSRCYSELAKQKQQLTAKGAKILEVQQCSLKAYESDQSQSTYSVTASILFI